ncbi:hypothetical protein RchiOBHm_Chr5g0061321 [Rosa chinensis]|uniref:Uncharacterized protein n=1 Tax=Rosa chinensis TaxID=74649 RepID=A0A2P6QHW8_ROSCH|nr:hypothetical protein RchiOBHm_Chr5g0061321 [Rosa chinensis]
MKKKKSKPFEIHDTQVVSLDLSPTSLRLSKHIIVFSEMKGDGVC